MKVTFRNTLITECPHGGADESEVEVVWVLTGDEWIDAEVVAQAVHEHDRLTIYAEDLAKAIYGRLEQNGKSPLSVTVHQIVGHGVTVEVP